MKTIQLLDRSKAGRYFEKNESYPYGKAKREVINISGKYFTYPIIGYLRRQVMGKVFRAFYLMTERDQAGKNTQKEH